MCVADNSVPRRARVRRVVSQRPPRGATKSGPQVLCQGAKETLKNACNDGVNRKPYLLIKAQDNSSHDSKGQQQMMSAQSGSFDTVSPSTPSLLHADLPIDLSFEQGSDLHIAFSTSIADWLGTPRVRPNDSPEIDTEASPGMQGLSPHTRKHQKAGKHLMEKGRQRTCERSAPPAHVSRKESDLLPGACPSSPSHSRVGSLRSAELYRQYEHQRELRAQQQDIALAVRRTEEMRECTFHPQINSELDMSLRRLSLYERGVERQERRDLLQRQDIEQKRREELNDCTFHPDLRRSLSTRAVHRMATPTNPSLRGLSHQSGGASDKPACEVTSAVHVMLENWRSERSLSSFSDGSLDLTSKSDMMCNSSSPPQSRLGVQGSSALSVSGQDSACVLSLLEVWKQRRPQKGIECTA